jgi:hypothetical protein
MELAKFLVLRSPNLSNIGVIKQRASGTIHPDYYEISEKELDEFKALSDPHKKAFIEEKIIAKESQILSAQPEKKNVEVAEVISESVSIPEVESEPLNEPINEASEVIEEPKAKGRPKKVN